MSYYDYERTRAYGNAMELAKKPGQRFCDQVGWKLSQHYREIQRPDKIQMIGGTIYRTITPTTHCWYQNNNSGEHVWVEFSSSGAITVKKGIRVTKSPGCGFNTVSLHPDPDYYEEQRVFSSNHAACDYLLSIGQS